MLRDGRWREEESAILVPGDIISIKLGDIIPADARLLEGDPLKIDQVPAVPCLVPNLGRITVYSCGLILGFIILCIRICDIIGDRFLFRGGIIQGSFKQIHRTRYQRHPFPSCIIISNMSKTSKYLIIL